jgi:hypothetical protein
VLTAERTARCHSVKSDDQLRSKGEPNAGAAHEGGRDRVAVDRRWREAAEFERRDGHARGEQHVVVAEEAEPDSGVACLSLPRPVYGIGRACYRAPAVGGIASHRCEPAGKTDTNGPPGPGESVTDQPMPAARGADGAPGCSCRCPGGPIQRLVADSWALLPGMACRALASRWGPVVA